ncbi:MAG: helix-turn-helix domain-containing protein [Oscillospiraceae bacterium]|nr:helix-turn-helix domain-containing protein [Oscillospiraceae bacterium]
MKTSNIEEKLEGDKAFDEKIIVDNAPPKLHVLLNDYLAKKQLTKADVIRRLNIDRNYGYQVFNGKRTPTRNLLIRLALMLELDVEQTDYLLKLGGKPMLYVRNVVDARIFYSIKHQMGYEDAIMFIWNGDEA